MKRFLLGGVIAGALTLGAATPSLAQSDISARYEMSEEAPGSFDMEMTIEVSEEGHVRIQMRGMPAYYLYRDDIFYIVQRGVDGPVVNVMSELLNVQMEHARKMFGEDFGPDFEDTDFPEITYVAMGEETVNGRTGTAYRMQGDDDEPPLRGQFVISHDEELAPLGTAIQRANAGMTRGMSGPFARLGLAVVEMNSIMSEGAPLRMMWLELTDVSATDIPDERFELPSEPQTIDQIRAQLVPFDPAPNLPAPAE